MPSGGSPMPRDWPKGVGDGVCLPLFLTLAIADILVEGRGPRAEDGGQKTEDGVRRRAGGPASTRLRIDSGLPAGSEFLAHPVFAYLPGPGTSGGRLESRLRRRSSLTIRRWAVCKRVRPMNRLRGTVEAAAPTRSGAAGRLSAKRCREGNVPASLALNRLLGFCGWCGTRCLE
jgi:hypothetical protein